jgi:hypothetical protein
MQLTSRAACLGCVATPTLHPPLPHAKALSHCGGINGLFYVGWRQISNIDLFPYCATFLMVGDVGICFIRGMPGDSQLNSQPSIMLPCSLLAQANNLLSNFRLLITTRSGLLCYHKPREFLPR